MLVCMIFRLISIGFDIFQKISKKIWLHFLKQVVSPPSINFFIIAFPSILGVYCLYEKRKTYQKTGADHLV